MFQLFAANPASARRLLSEHPLWISALIEDAWNRNPAAQRSPFTPWPPPMIRRIYDDFGQPSPFPPDFRWEHLIYAHLIEMTGIVRVFEKVMQAFLMSEDLSTPSYQTQQFWRNTEALFYARPDPTTVWHTIGSTRPNETANRMSNYWRMFGLELGDLADPGPDCVFQKDAAANEGFKSTFETLASETWVGIVNTRNIAGRNDADDAAIATAAARLHDMLLTRRENFNLLREEYRAVLLTSWLHLAVSFDSPVVRDLRASAQSPDLRLANIAHRVGMKINPATRALFDLAEPMSVLLHALEAGRFATARTARRLYRAPGWRAIAETVIENYSLATTQNLKARPVSILPPPAQPVAVSGRPRSGQPVEPQRHVALIGSRRY